MQQRKEAENCLELTKSKFITVFGNFLFAKGCDLNYFRYLCAQKQGLFARIDSQSVTIPHYFQPTNI